MLVLHAIQSKAWTLEMVYKAIDVVLELLVKLGKAMDTMFMATMPQPPTGMEITLNQIFGGIGIPHVQQGNEAIRGGAYPAFVSGVVQHVQSVCTMYTTFWL